MEPKVGSRWRSALGSAEVVVVRAPSLPAEMACAGAAMVEAVTGAAPAPSVKPATSVAGGGGKAGGGTGGPGTAGEELLLGKRYEEGSSGIEVLCTKPGLGPLTCNGAILVPKSAKPLPSSD